MLQTADGSPDCYPFAESVGPIDNYPRSQDPQCQLPSDAGADAVCAYKYSALEEESCEGSEYEIFNYDSVEAATADGAVPVHSGACGVCSNAADLAVRLTTLDDFAATVTFCAVSYSLSGSADRFENLVACHRNPAVLGLSQECALLWAHYSAVNSILCRDECAANADSNKPYNEDPPTCELLDCLSCSRNLFQAEQDALAGFVPTRGGIVENEAYWPCEDYPLYASHAPCSGELLSCAIDESSTTGPPTEAPTPTSAAAFDGALWSLVAETMLIVACMNQYL
jgi:hypothetical protein